MCKIAYPKEFPHKLFLTILSKKRGGFRPAVSSMAIHCVGGGGGGVTSFLSFKCPGAVASAAEKEARLDLLLSRFPGWLPSVRVFSAFALTSISLISFRARVAIKMHPTDKGGKKTAQGRGGNLFLNVPKKKNRKNEPRFKV